ncbi:MAG: hypothetical protein Q7S99_02535 [Parvibaculum sp.]|nr:hypothetical protein [Parvibaculum sp.]
MNYRDLSRLMLKLLGLFIIASALARIPLSILALQIKTTHLTWTIWLIGYALPLTTVLLFGLILFRADKRITNTFITEVGAEELATGINYTRIEEILIALLGFYFIADALPHTLVVTGQYIALYSASGPTTIPSFSTIANQLIALIIGILLVVGSRGLALWRHRFLSLRNAGRIYDSDE